MLNVVSGRLSSVLAVSDVRKFVTVSIALTAPFVIGSLKDEYKGNARFYFINGINQKISLEYLEFFREKETQTPNE